MWLMSKNRLEDARKSLQWLRGWVSPAAVAKEFAEIQRYTEFSKSCADCSKFDQKCPHPPPSFVEGLQELLRKRTLKPFVIVCMAYVFSQFSGYYSVRPYIVLIFKVYGIPIDPNWATVYLGVSGILGTLTCISLIKFCGKRGLFISGISILCICNFGLSIYGFVSLPAGITSFSAPPQTNSANGNIFVISVCVLMAFITSFGATSVPSMLLSELFPLKYVSSWNIVAHFRIHFIKSNVSFFAERDVPQLEYRALLLTSRYSWQIKRSWILKQFSVYPEHSHSTASFASSVLW